jgi:hypothetical protein
MSVALFEKPVPTQPVKKFPVFYVILGLLPNKQRSDKRRLLNLFYSVLYLLTQIIYGALFYLYLTKTMAVLSRPLIFVFPY